MTLASRLGGRHVALLVIATVALASAACGGDGDVTVTGETDADPAAEPAGDATTSGEEDNQGDDSLGVVSSGDADQGADADAAEADPSDDPLAGMSSPEDAEDYVGLGKDDAIDKADEDGREWRLVREDDEFFPLTEDLRFERINFEIDDGIVTSAEYG